MALAPPLVLIRSSSLLTLDPSRSKLLGFGYTNNPNANGNNGGGGAGIQFTNVTTDGGISKLGVQSTSSDNPAVGCIIAAGDSLSIPVDFNFKTAGNYQSLLQVWSIGGSKDVLFTGSATTAPIAELALETGEHGWDTASGVIEFGTVLTGTTQPTETSHLQQRWLITADYQKQAFNTDRTAC